MQDPAASNCRVLCIIDTLQVDRCRHRCYDDSMTTTTKESAMRTFQQGDTVYWNRVPSGKFTFRHVNPDGSLSLFGGEKGHGAFRDARPEDVSDRPSEGNDQILHFAKNNLFVHVRVVDLMQMFDLKEHAVRKVIFDNPGMFRRVEHGVFEIRDAEEDRKVK